MAAPYSRDNGRRRGWGPRRPESGGTAEGVAGAPPGAKPSATQRRRRWQRWLFGVLGVAWMVIGVSTGLVAGNWTVAGLWFALAAMELVLWIMAGRR